MVALYPIVEGHGETRAVPILLRRIAQEICLRNDVQILKPHRVPRGLMLAHGSSELLKAVELGARKIHHSGTSGAVMVMLDADDDCPADLGPRLLCRIHRADQGTSVVIANREYEAWFLAAVESLRTHRIVSNTAVSPEYPEAIRGAKEHLKRHILVSGARYRETVDQPALTAVLALDQARAAPSFDKLCRDVCRFLSPAS